MQKALVKVQKERERDRKREKERDREKERVQTYITNMILKKKESKGKNIILINNSRFLHDYSILL